MLSSPSCQLARLLQDLAQLYIIVLVVYAVVSWIPSLRGRWTIYLERAVEPVLTPMRRVIPSVGGLDLSFLLLFLLVQWVSGAIVRLSCSRF